ncbi:hypothetical protein GR28A_00115 [Vibrio phage vB_VcorM_GR28A]|nr:hypothetical protein GR28A_00115 [Vibrio phage vB_VcorM_GR28A]
MSKDSKDIIQLGARTLAILDNFKTISNSIQLSEGQTLVIGDPETGSILAKAQIDETLPVDFSVANLGGLLKILKMRAFTESKLDFTNEGVVDIAGKGQKIKYYASDSMFAEIPEEFPEIEDEGFRAQITPEVSKDFESGCAAMGLTHAGLVIKDKKAYLIGHNPELPNDTNYSIELGDSELDDFTVDIKVAFLKKVLEGNYTLTADDRMAVFTSADERLEYIIGSEIPD